MYIFNRHTRTYIEYGLCLYYACYINHNKYFVIYVEMHLVEMNLFMIIVNSTLVYIHIITSFSLGY